MTGEFQTEVDIMEMIDYTLPCVFIVAGLVLLKSILDKDLRGK